MADEGVTNVKNVIAQLNVKKFKPPTVESQPGPGAKPSTGKKPQVGAAKPAISSTKPKSAVSSAAKKVPTAIAIKPQDVIGPSRLKPSKPKNTPTPNSPNPISTKTAGNSAKSEGSGINDTTSEPPWKKDLVKHVGNSAKSEGSGNNDTTSEPPWKKDLVKNVGNSAKSESSGNNDTTSEPPWKKDLVKKKQVPRPSSKPPADVISTDKSLTAHHPPDREDGVVQIQQAAGSVATTGTQSSTPDETASDTSLSTSASPSSVRSLKNAFESCPANDPGEVKPITKRPISQRELKQNCVVANHFDQSPTVAMSTNKENTPSTQPIITKPPLDRNVKPAVEARAVHKTGSIPPRPPSLKPATVTAPPNVSPVVQPSTDDDVFVVASSGRRYRRLPPPTDDSPKKAARKPAKPPRVDLSAFREPDDQEDDDIYDDAQDLSACRATFRDNRTSARRSEVVSQIAEYTEEEEESERHRLNNVGVISRAESNRAASSTDSDIYDDVAPTEEVPEDDDVYQALD